MNLVIPPAVLYLPAAAVFITFVGAAMNREPPVVLAPLALGLVAGSVMAVGGLVWLFLPVVVIWLVGMGTMVHRHRDDPRNQR